MADDEQEQAPGNGQPEEQAPDGEPRQPPKHADDAEKGGKGETRENADARGTKEGRKNKKADEREPLGDGVYQRFYGTVFAPNATFGTSGGGAGGDEQRGRGRDEGRVDETVIAGVVRAYAKPACYEKAELALRDKHVVILTGEAGSGRRAGALVMLGGVRARDKPLVRINPSITIEKLAARSFVEGVGYLIARSLPSRSCPNSRSSTGMRSATRSGRQRRTSS